MAENEPQNEPQNDVGKWRAQLPDDLKENEEMKKYNTLGDLGKAHIQAISGMKGMVRVPGKDAKPEDLQAFRKAVGVPEKPDAYQFDAKQLPEGVKIDDDMVSWFRTVAHKADLNPDQAKILYNSFYDRTVGGIVAQTKALAEGKKKLEDDLKRELGDKYNESIAHARKVVFEIAPEGLAKYLEDTGLGNHPLMTKLFIKVGSMIKEDSVGKTGAGGEKKTLISGEIHYDKSPELYGAKA